MGGLPRRDIDVWILERQIRFADRVQTYWNAHGQFYDGRAAYVRTFPKAVGRNSLAARDAIDLAEDMGLFHGISYEGTYVSGHDNYQLRIDKVALDTFLNKHYR